MWYLKSRLALLFNGMKITSEFKRVSILSLLALFLSACGYHLRGDIDLPPGLQKVYVRGASLELSEAIKQSFRSTSSQLVTSKAEAGLILNIIDEEYRRRTISISSQGYSNEYELEYRLVFDLYDKNSITLMPVQTIEVSQAYYNQQSGKTVLSKDNEEKILRKELYLKAVRSVIQRASVELKKSLP